MGDRGVVTVEKAGPNSKAKAKTKSRKPMAAHRFGIIEAHRWYIQGLVPADGDRPEIRQPSLDDLSRVVGISRRTLENRSTTEGWVLQKETFAKQALALENEKLLQAMADQHARVRTAYFRTSMRGQGLLDRKLAAEGEALDMQAVAAAMTALGKAQLITDTAILGPKAMQAPGAITQNTIQNKIVGWAAISGRPSAALQASLIALDQEDA